MLLRRRLVSGICAGAALLPALFWLLPAARGAAPTLRDQADFFYPLKLYTADRLRAGDVPLWNPLSGTGEPWLANGQSGVFYPPTLFFLLPASGLAGGLFLLLHFAIAAWGARRFLKEENVSDAGALLGAAAFAASGFAVSFSVFWNHFGAFAYLPGIAALARSGLRTRASVLGLAALVGLQAMAGSPEMSAASIALALALAGKPRAPLPEPLVPVPRWSGLRRSGAGVLLGLALAAWVLVPMAELSAHSDRRGPLPAHARDLGAVGASDLLSVAGFTPPFFGGTYLASLFLPPFALVAAAAAFGEPHRRRLVLMLAVFAAAGILLSLPGPPGTWLRAVPPLDRIRYASKGLAWTAFSAAMLAGLGLDALRFGAEDSRRRVKLGFGFAAVGALALAALAPLPPAVRLASGIGSAAVGLLALGAGRRVWAGALAAGASAAALVVSLALALAVVPRFASEEGIRRCPDVLESLRRIPGRVLTPPMGPLAAWAMRDGTFDAAALARQREALLGYTNLTCRVPTVRTPAALPTEAAAAMQASFDESVRPAAAANARALWTPFPPENLGSRKVGDFYRAPLEPYRPRFSFLRRYRIEPDAARAWQRVAAGEVDLAREVLLDRRPEPDPSGPETRTDASPMPMLVARLAEDRPEEIVAELTTSSPGLLVVTDLHYPGWIAEAEGLRLPILRADGWFRAVALPAGTHRVVFRYRPVSVYVGAGISAATLLAMLLLWLRGEPLRRGRPA